MEPQKCKELLKKSYGNRIYFEAPEQEAYFAPGGGACPAGRRLTVPSRNPQGGLAFLVARRP